MRLVIARLTLLAYLLVVGTLTAGGSIVAIAPPSTHVTIGSDAADDSDALTADADADDDVDDALADSDSDASDDDALPSATHGLVAPTACTLSSALELLQPASVPLASLFRPPRLASV